MTTPLPPGQIVTLNGMQMYYVLAGQGETLVLLTGYTGASNDWAVFFDDLVGQYQVVIPDLRGHGRSTNPLGEFTFRQAARDVSGLLDYLGIERFKAIGFSGGGNLLLHLATQQPSRVEAMVIVSATTHYPEQARTIMHRYTLDQLPDEERLRLQELHQGGEEQIRELFRQGQAFAGQYDDMNFTVASLSSSSEGANMDTKHYSMNIQWSDEDQVYIVTVPELPGCKTHGSTYEEAVKQGQDAIESWITVAQELGRHVPPPNKIAV